MSAQDGSRWWFWTALALTAVKLWLTAGQTIYAIGPAIHDDKLFAQLAAHILNGEWLGPYTQFTLAKGPLFSLFIASAFRLGLPLIFAQQLIYAGACAVVTHSLAPWLRSGAARFSLYALLLCNPMSYDAGNLSRLMRQNIYTPLGLLVIAGLVYLFTRRREPWHRQVGPAALAGLALGGFWLTREESIWLLPAVGLLLFGIAASLDRELHSHGRALTASFAILTVAALLPILAVCTLNLRHYGWFGTVEFRASEFKDAYGALTRLKAGPELPQVPVTRQMREQAYRLSPAFAKLQPYIEGAVGDHWVETTLFPASERQIRGGWFIWALRDATVAAGLAPDAGTGMRYYQQVADEVNAACDAGRVPARPRRSGFLPPLDENLIQPLTGGFLEYGAFFLGFKGFTAVSPDSVGDYADLKPFRDLAGTPLSHAPRSPLPSDPDQTTLDGWKMGLLEKTGTTLGFCLMVAGPFILLAGLLRAFESLLERRLTFLLGVAGALLTSCAAYLAINVLVHVTSFYNMSPAAMAAAYPLYLLALVVIVVDAAATWGRAAVATTTPERGAPVRWLWLMPAGTALFVFAARLGEVHAFASDVPYNDQWFIEARQIIAPWLDGTLHLTDFFRPHFEHLPVWTRLLAWLEVVVTGRWDPLVQMTVNTGLHTAFVWFVTRWVWRTLAVRAALLITLLLLLGAALPHAWENIAWGFQSQFPVALLCLFAHGHGVLTHPPGSRSWWLAQAAGLAGLLTLASMWVAPLAVAAALFWTGRREGKPLVAPLAIAGLGILILAIIRAQGDSGGFFAQVTGSPFDFLHSFMHLLGWPTGVPGALAVLQLPWLLHALHIRGRADLPAIDRIIFALGLWSVVQAAALGFARNGDTADYVSRYGDLLFVGVLAGALALARLTFDSVRGRRLFTAGTVLWAGFVTWGLVIRSTEGHARYFHQTAAQTAALRRDAVQAYLRNGDRQLLEKPETRWVLSQSTDVVTGLLDRPALRALLPASVNPASPPDEAGKFVRELQSRWWWLLAAGALLVSASGVRVICHGATAAAPLPPLVITSDRRLGRLALGAGLIAGALVFSWPDPLSFSPDYRWNQVLGGKQAIQNLTFEFAAPTPFGPERLQGAAPLRPPVLRNQFFGTAPAGPELTCTVLSSPFAITKPLLVVPYAGYPVGNGNGLRVRIVDEEGRKVGDEIGCPGPNLDGIGFWLVNLRAHLGRKARLVLYDGRTDTEAWVAAAPPIPTESAGLADTLARRLKQEQHANVHTGLAVVAVVALLGAIISWWYRRR